MPKRKPRTFGEAGDNLDAALRELGRALLATMPGRTLERFTAWLSHRLGSGPTP